MYLCSGQMNVEKSTDEPDTIASFLQLAAGFFVVICYCEVSTNFFFFEIRDKKTGTKRKKNLNEICCSFESVQMLYHIYTTFILMIEEIMEMHHVFYSTVRRKHFNVIQFFYKETIAHSHLSY